MVALAASPPGPRPTLSLRGPRHIAISAAVVLGDEFPHAELTHHDALQAAQEENSQ
jgi:hypothetical protein